METNFDYKDIRGIILCGGQSSRMGQDKSLLTIGGVPFYRLIREILNKYCDEVYVSCRPDQVKNYDNIPTIIDEEENSGPISGIIASLKNANGSSILTVPCDMPEVNKDVIDKMMSLLVDDVAGIFTTKNGLIEPLFGIYHPGLLPALQETLIEGNLSLKRFLENRPDLALFELDDDEIINLNTQKDREDFFLKRNLNK